MKLLKRHIAYALSLSLIIISNYALTKENIVQGIHKTENKSTTSKPSVYSAYYNMYVLNASETAVVKIKRDQYECMYGAGPEDEFTLSHYEEKHFNLEDDDNIFHNCNASAKWVTWNIEYDAPNGEKKYCNVKLLTDYIDMEDGWRTYFYPTPGTNCQVPVNFVCDDSESNCRDGYVSHDSSVNTLVITK
ncbi:hypothetical protein Xsto_01932 [Xenorhabdus stockiae]|uniref:Secreted protein n=1 Tax=Xenorhabdus stockiae TaxID=351614 RepID=A0A2D0KQ71_9GAMM|nr:hypothetical protein [Xenorhabdus stockiae]PHM65574.1 hypothetical protein Xsto_01932 [Xenorhabdus stockiae]